MNQKEAKLPGIGEKTRVEYDFTLADKAGGIDGGAAACGTRDQLPPVCSQMRSKRNRDGAARERRHASQQRSELSDATAMAWGPKCPESELRYFLPGARATECFRC